MVQITLFKLRTSSQLVFISMLQFANVLVQDLFSIFVNFGYLLVFEELRWNISDASSLTTVHGQHFGHLDLRLLLDHLILELP